MEFESSCSEEINFEMQKINDDTFKFIWGGRGGSFLNFFLMLL